MPFAAKPSFRIRCQPLTYETAGQHYKNTSLWHRNHAGANISDRRPGDSKYWLYRDVRRNPINNEMMGCYYLRMYNTDIHTWWEDGTYKSVYWDSAITRDVLSTFGPVRVWRDSRCKYECKDRFGLRYEAGGMPYEQGITVDPEGWIRNVRDHTYVLKEGARKERAKIREAFLTNTVSRIMLGEFNIDFFARYRTDVKKGFGRYETGWMAQVPVGGSGIAKAFDQQAEYAEIQKRIVDCWQWSYGPSRPTKEAAALVAINMMADQILSNTRWYEKQPLSYGDVNVKELR